MTTKYKEFFKEEEKKGQTNGIKAHLLALLSDAVIWRRAKPQQGWWCMLILGGWRYFITVSLNYLNGRTIG